jgi:hypothetical protein
MKEALDYIENEPTIFRYAWFSGRTTAIANVDLLAGAGALTTLGGDYVSFPSRRRASGERVSAPGRPSPGGARAAARAPAALRGPVSRSPGRIRDGPTNNTRVILTNAVLPG